jgi:hypothetical protein
MKVTTKEHLDFINKIQKEYPAENGYYVVFTVNDNGTKTIEHFNPKTKDVKPVAVIH